MGTGQRLPSTHLLDSQVQCVNFLGAVAREPDLLALSLTTRQWLRAARVVGELRTRLDVPVITGGPHPVFAAEEVLASPGFDFVCIGEGEAATLDLAEWEQLVSITVEEVRKGREPGGPDA